MTSWNRGRHFLLKAWSETDSALSSLDTNDIFTS
jgi:hypothetical protein